MAEPHPLLAFELTQSAIEGAFKASFVAKQAIESVAVGNAVAKRFQLHSHRLHRGARLPVAIEATNLFVNSSQYFLSTLLW